MALSLRKILHGDVLNKYENKIATDGRGSWPGPFGDCHTAHIPSWILHWKWTHEELEKPHTHGFFVILLHLHNYSHRTSWEYKHCILLSLHAECVHSILAWLHAGYMHYILLAQGREGKEFKVTWTCLNCHTNLEKQIYCYLFFLYLFNICQGLRNRHMRTALSVLYYP